MPPIFLPPHLPGSQVSTDQARHLRGAQAGHLDQELPQHAARFLGLLGVMMALQCLLDPSIDSGSIRSVEVDTLAGLQEPPNFGGGLPKALYDQCFRKASPPTSAVYPFCARIVARARKRRPSERRSLRTGLLFGCLLRPA